MPWQIENYFRSLSEELEALKNRVRHFINDQHWLTDGEWKESVLRSIFQRTAPNNITVGRGFIIGKDGPSTQIDILIYDNSYPVLYKDGDLVFIIPEACRGIIEVKTSIDKTRFLDTVKTLGDNALIARGLVLIPPHEWQQPVSRFHIKQPSVFIGMFVYDTPRRFDMLELLNEGADGHFNRIVDHVSIGRSKFFKFWTRNPLNGERPYCNWHEYNLDNMAPGYFIHNLLTHLAPNNKARKDQDWFPRTGKEPHLENIFEFFGTTPKYRERHAVQNRNR